MSTVPHPVDSHVGSRLRLRRTLLGMSQEKLGQALGLTFQQVQKYERGANRISASKLHDVSKILDVQISFFFDSMVGPAKPVSGLSEAAPEPFEADQLQRRETIDLVRAYYRIANPQVRRRILDLIKAVSTSDTASRAAS